MDTLSPLILISQRVWWVHWSLSKQMTWPWPGGNIVCSNLSSKQTKQGVYSVLTPNMSVIIKMNHPFQLTDWMTARFQQYSTEHQICVQTLTYGSKSDTLSNIRVLCLCEWSHWIYQTFSSVLLSVSPSHNRSHCSHPMFKEARFKQQHQLHCAARVRNIRTNRPLC